MLVLYPASARPGRTLLRRGPTRRAGRAGFPGASDHSTGRRDSWFAEPLVATGLTRAYNPLSTPERGAPSVRKDTGGAAMSEDFTDSGGVEYGESTTQGWFSRIMESIKGV